MGLIPLQQRLLSLASCLAVEALVVPLAGLLPATPIPATSFYGSHFAWSKLCIFVTMVPLGFVFVAHVDGRKNPFLSRSSSPRDFLLLLVATVVVFFHCPIRTLHDLSDNGGISNARLLHPAFPADRLESYLYNYLCYAVPFFIGLHFRLLDDVPLLNEMFYRVTWPPSVEAYGLRQYLVLGGIVVLAAAIVAFFLFLYFQAGLLLIYLGLLGSLLASLVVLTFALRKTHYLHLHHFFIFGVLFLFTPFQNVPAAIIQALLLGASVEGISTWGFSGIYSRYHRRAPAVGPTSPLTNGDH